MIKCFGENICSQVLKYLLIKPKMIKNSFQKVMSFKALIFTVKNKQNI